MPTLDPERALEAALQWALPLGLLVGGFFLGWLLDRTLIARLRRFAETSSWQVDDIALGALGRMTVLWAGLTGAYFAALNLPLDVTPSARQAISTALFILSAFSVTIVVARAAVGLVHVWAESAPGVLPSTSIFANGIKLVVLLVGGLIILQSLGVSVTPLITALGVGGLAVSLALQDTLSNLFSGFQILSSRHVRPGDYIKLGSGEEGYVRDITWRIATIETTGRVMVVVPNNKLSGAILTNYHQPQLEMSLLVPVGVSYDSDLEHVERVTVEVARGVMEETEGGVPGYEPLVRYNGFGDSAITFNVVLRVREFNDQFPVRHEFIKRLHRRYRDEGVDIPFPMRTVIMKGTPREAIAADD